MKKNGTNTRKVYTHMNNLEKNTYVKEAIFQTTIHLLEQKELSDISISQIAQDSGVSRTSFYRNYADKESILRDYNYMLLKSWQTDHGKKGHLSDADTMESLFVYLKKDKSFFLLLYKRRLFILFLEAFLQIFGPNRDCSLEEIYGASFAVYGVYGWIEAWVRRGMEDSPEIMKALMSDFEKLYKPTSPDQRR